jgi:hypothetical protein
MPKSARITGALKCKERRKIRGWPGFQVYVYELDDAAKDTDVVGEAVA